MSPRVPRLNRDLQVSAKAVSRACNSVECGLPPDDNIYSYGKYWDYLSDRGRIGVSCFVTLVDPVTGELFTIEVWFIFKENRPRDVKYPRLCFYPYLINRKRVRLSSLLFRQFKEQAKRAYSKCCQENNVLENSSFSWK